MKVAYEQRILLEGRRVDTYMTFVSGHFITRSMLLRILSCRSSSIRPSKSALLETPAIDATPPDPSDVSQCR